MTCRARLLCFLVLSRVPIPSVVVLARTMLLAEALVATRLSFGPVIGYHSRLPFTGQCLKGGVLPSMTLYVL